MALKPYPDAKPTLGAITRGGAAFTSSAPDSLPLAGVDQSDGTAALLVQQSSGSAGSATANPAYSRIQDGTTANLATVGSNGALLVEISSTQTQVEASGTAAAAATLAVSLPAPGAGLTNYITGFELTAAVATAPVSGAVTITGLATTMNYQFTESATQQNQLIVTFSDPIAANAANTAIAVTLAAITGGSATALNVHGFYR